MRKKRGYWTSMKCIEITMHCISIRDFKIKYFNAYNAIKRNNWYYILDNAFPNRTKPKGYWTKERCKSEALKYEYRIDFEKCSGSAYVIARKNKWLDDICSHMIKIGNRYNKCVYSYEFSDNFVYVGITYNMERRIIDRKKCKTDSVTVHINKTGLIPKLVKLTDYVLVDDAVLLEEKYVLSYKNKGWNILNKVKTGSIGSVLIWTKEKCFNEIKIHKTRSSFIHKSKGAYDAAKRYGWINDIYLSVGL